MSGCPTREGLEQYVTNQMDEAQAAEVESHAAGCQRCVRAMNRMVDHDDLVRELREAESSVRETEAIVSTAAQAVSTLTGVELSPLQRGSMRRLGASRATR